MTDFELNLQQDGWVEVTECYPPTAATSSAKMRGAGPKLATPVHTTGAHLSTTKGNDCSLQEWFDPCGAGGLVEIVAQSGPSKFSVTPPPASMVDREQAMVAPTGPSKFFSTPPAFMVDLGNGRKVVRKTRGVPMI
jgi:hypothetical protein